MEEPMKLLTRILLPLCAVAALGTTPSALADTPPSSGDSLNAQLAQLQQQIKLRHQLDDDLIQSQLALGYSVPEVLESSGRTMLAKADDDAFTRAMNNLHLTMTMFAVAD
jgi:hypothetical protein